MKGKVEADRAGFWTYLRLRSDHGGSAKSQKEGEEG